MIDPGNGLSTIMSSEIDSKGRSNLSRQQALSLEEIIRSNSKSKHVSKKAHSIDHGNVFSKGSS